MGDLSFVWLEVTGKCQLQCVHCYAESGPSGTHGKMGTADWLRVIDQATDLGVRAAQFIGGEPTVHPDLATLAVHALNRGLQVEVFSNLVHVRPALWELFSTPGVSLATSYYSDDPSQHEEITGRRGSYTKTRANITEAAKREIPLRVGVIDLAKSSAGGRQLPSWKRWVSLLSAAIGSVRSDAVSGMRGQIRTSYAGTALIASRRSHLRVGYGRACSPAGCPQETYWSGAWPKSWTAVCGRVVAN